MAGWLIASLFLFAPAAKAECIAPVLCDVETGRFLVRLPQSPSSSGPIIVFYHGWRETPAVLLADAALTTFADAHGATLVAPEGLGQTWSYPGSPGQFRDERPFAEDVFKALRQRFPGKPIIAAGFSQGASQVWWLACRQPHLADAYVALAGGFWEPSPQACSGKGVTLVHIHGKGDVTVPLAGRAIRGGTFRQSDILRDWPIWIAENKCEAKPKKSLTESGRSCDIWTNCGVSKQLAFCLHSGGHQIHREDMDVMRAVLGSTFFGTKPAQ